jgi:hypothetical protein
VADTLQDLKGFVGLLRVNAPHQLLDRFSRIAAMNRVGLAMLTVKWFAASRA